MHKTQIAFWTCIALFIGIASTYSVAPRRGAKQHPTEHTPQTEFPLKSSPTPSPSSSPNQTSTSTLTTESPLPTQTPNLPPWGTPKPFVSPTQTPNLPPRGGTPEPNPSVSTQVVDNTDSPPQKIDLSQFPATAVDEVVVPLPSEIFNVLDKTGSPNWKEEFPASFGKATGNRAEVALLLGSVIADGFVAVEAEDPEKVKTVGREVLNLAEAINVRKAVIARSKSITDATDAKNWPTVRQELDGALQDVRTAMQELNDNDIAQLVSLGGWLRGTEVLTSIVKKSYNPQIAELLHQPELINYFIRRIDNMPKRLKRSALVDSIRDTLLNIQSLISADTTKGKNITEENVKQISTLAHKIVQSFTPQK